MRDSLTTIAKTLKDTEKKVQLIYAFNGTGKTRLSREFKHIIEPENDLEETTPKILYYNAFTEDLFYWDNNVEGTPTLKIQPNSFTDWILKDQGQDQNIIKNFQSYTNQKLTPQFKENNTQQNNSNDFSKITFSYTSGDDKTFNDIKISKGEESNFIWSVFYTLIEQVISVLNVSEPNERETNQFDKLEYIFIDDPVSSLDENNLIEVAVNLSALIKSSKSDQVKFIVTTHNPLFFNILCNELNTKTNYMLKKAESGFFEFDTKMGDSNKSFSYHLYIKSVIEEAIENNKIERYHFTLLRNLYEKTANFLGYKKWSDLLPDNKKPYLTRIINFTSHSTLSNEEIAYPSEPEKNIIKFLLENLTNKCNFNSKDTKK